MGNEVTINKVVYDPTKYKDGGNYIKYMNVDEVVEKYNLHQNHNALLKMIANYYEIDKDRFDEFIKYLEFNKISPLTSESPKIYDHSDIPTIIHKKKNILGEEVIILYILYFHNSYNIIDIRNVIKENNGTEKQTYLFVSNYPNRNKDIKKVKGLEGFEGKIIIVAYMG